jgi:excisionase family DNA binding protein
MGQLESNREVPRKFKAAPYQKEFIMPLTDTVRVEPRLFTARSAAEYLGRSESAIRNLIFKKQIKITRAGRAVRLDRQDLDRWIESGNAGS